MFLKKKKKSICDHYWHKLSDEKEWYHGSGIEDLELIDVTYIFCEKCKVEIKVSPEKWKRVNRKQEILQ